MHKSGFVSIIGRPNVGKSTLLNRIIGTKVAITSYKPQTTRTQIQGVYTCDEGQIVFIDTPGIHKPVHKLDEYMEEAVHRSMGGVDLLLFLTEPGRPKQADLDILKGIKGSTPIVLVINKMDTVPKTELLVTMEGFKNAFNFAAMIPISARTGENMEELLHFVWAQLPEGPAFFPEDMITDQPERQLIAEFVREKALLLLNQEIPHGIAVEIEQFKERAEKNIIDIDATIICEKESHKPIIIGKGGKTLKEIGSRARREMEELLGVKVNLKLWVKVRERWRDSEIFVRNFGFDKKNLQ